MRVSPSQSAPPAAARRPLALLPNVPWTLASLALVVILNAAAGTLQAKPTAALTRRYGLGLDTLREGKVWTLLTSNYLLDHPKALLSTLAVVGLYLGVYELLAGTRAAVAAWFLGGAVTSVTIAPLMWLPFAWLGWAPSVRAVASAEFGSSAATWCCLGAVVGLPGHWRGWRLWAGLAGVALLAGRLAIYRGYTDVEHIAAFGFGVLVLAWLAVPGPSRVRVSSWQIARVGVALAGLLIVMTGALVATLDQATYTRCALIVVGGLLLIVSALVAPRRADPAVLALLIGAGALAIGQIPNVATIALVVGSGVALLAAWRRDPAGHALARSPTPGA